MGDKGVSRPEFQRVTLGTMTSRDEGFLALLPFARTSSSIQGREGECSGRSRRRKRKLRGCCGGWKGGKRRTSEQKVETEAKTCAHTCVSLRKPLHQLYLRVLLSKPRKVLILMELSIYICTVGSFFLTKYHFERE